MLAGTCPQVSGRKGEQTQQEDRLVTTSRLRHSGRTNCQQTRGCMWRGGTQSARPVQWLFPSLGVDRPQPALGLGCPPTQSPDSTVSMWGPQQAQDWKSKKKMVCLLKGITVPFKKRICTELGPNSPRHNP